MLFMCATGWINGSIGIATAYFSSLMTAELWVDIVLACKDFSRADESRLCQNVFCQTFSTATLIYSYLQC
jgi:hypothetical protein